MTPTTEELARELEALGDPSGGVTHTLRDKDVVGVPFGTLRAAAARLRELSEALKPFENLGADLPAMSGWPALEIIGRSGIRHNITERDFRRAAQLTETHSEP